MIPILAAGTLQSTALGLITAIGTLTIVAAGKWGLGRLQAMYMKSHAEDERLAGDRHKETMDGQTLLIASDARIEAHVEKTNGRVTALEDHRHIDLERISRIEGQLEEIGKMVGKLVDKLLEAKGVNQQ